MNLQAITYKHSCQSNLKSKNFFISIQSYSCRKGSAHSSKKTRTKQERKLRLR